MYIPRTFAERDDGVLHAFMDAHPFATLTTAAEGLYATHLPLILRDDGTIFVLEGHVARANPHVARLSAPCDALVIFSGANAHITPSWYPSKADDGRVVPTWNYAAVHVFGTLHLREDEDFLRAHLTRLSDRHEQARGSEWTTNDPPADYLTQQHRAIVGVEITIARLEGKWKMSQNRSEADRVGVVDGLRRAGVPADAEVADLVSERLIADQDA